jgi:hypothetical protein
MSTMTFLMAPGGVAAGPAASGGKARAAHDPSFAPDDPEVFLTPLLDCLPLARRAMLVLLGGVAALDACAVFAQGLVAQGHLIQGEGAGTGWRAWAALATGVAGAFLAAVSAGMLAVIQIRYTFEHAELHRARFYELKLARFREACAQLKSLAVEEAVAAVRAVQGLRKDIGGLDRRLAIETLMLRRRLRDLIWLTRAGAGLAALAAGLVLIEAGHAGVATLVTVVVMLAAIGLYAAIEAWVRERMGRVVALLAPTPAELAQAFDPSPPLEAAIERLLTRLNRHFDRLKGPFDPVEAENEPLG